MANWVITGGAGFLGINLTRYLLARDHHVTVLDTGDFDYPERDRVTVHRGDVRDESAVARAVAGARYLVHAAAALPRHSADDIRTIDVDGTRIVLESAESLGVERVIFISSTAVYGVPDHHPIRETDPLRGVGPYGEAKVEAERMCREARARGLCVPVLRPKSFVGPERLGVFGLLFDWAYTGHNFPLLGSGNNRFQLLDVEDLCRAIEIAATADAALANDDFNIGAEEFTTMRQDFQAVLDAAGHHKRIVPIPAKPAVMALRVLERLRLSPLYSWVYESAGTDSYVAIDKAQQTLGFKPRHSTRDALLRNYDWYVRNRALLAHEAQGLTHRTVWKEGALRLARAVF